MLTRRCGVLLHLTSLPSAYGIGDLGPAARHFAETLAASGLCAWQFLPFNPTEAFIGNSPYSSPSAFAGNPLLISPEDLLEEGLISKDDLREALAATPGGHLGLERSRVDFAAVIAHRDFLLRRVYERAAPGLERDGGFADFKEKEAYWLKDYALFTAIKGSLGGRAWTDWPEALKWRAPGALAAWEADNRAAVERQEYIQYLFQRGWARLHGLCRGLGLRLIGDLPIYVGHDSADVWARPHLFKLRADGGAEFVSGVPPDYFSETGQRWGNPVYDWARMAEDGFDWWKRRLGRNFALADIVRLDHFRGFLAYWEIPGEERTAVGGRWVKAPSGEFFAAMKRHFGSLSIIAEDLGVITDDVRDLMREYAFPGMKVLQFAFDGKAANNPDIPFRHPRLSVVYTGTHDNPPTLQWFDESPLERRKNFAAYRGETLTRGNACPTLVRMALESRAALAVIPMQDVLGLGAEARMNTPSLAEGNWTWRLYDRQGWLEEKFCLAEKARAERGGRPDGGAGRAEGAEKPELPFIFRRLNELCAIYGRLPE